MALELDDDVFFADLSKQIALLIMDEEEEFPVQSPPVRAQGFHHAPRTVMPPPYTYEMVCRRESKGTGVFIPRSSFPGRKNRSGKSSSINGNSQEQLNKSGVAVSQSPDFNRLQPNYYKNSGPLKSHTCLRYRTTSDSY